MTHTRRFQGLDGLANKAQDAHVLASLDQALRTSRDLVKRGLTLLKVEVQDRNPVIWVQATGACKQLRAITMVRRHGEGGMERVQAANFEGCQVQWVERGGV